MKRVLAVALVVLVAALCAFAEGTPSAKAGATLRTLNCVYPATVGSNWIDIGSPIVMKMNNVNELFIGVSLETGLYTETKVGTKYDATGALTSTAVAQAGVKVRVLIDDVPVAPGVVTFDQRIQTLSAKLGQALTGCSIDPLTHVVSCTGLTDQEIKLILETLGAHTFNFVQDNVGVGVHTLKVQFQLNKNASGDGSSSSAVAKVCGGLGSVTVESVRMGNYIEF